MKMKKTLKKLVCLITVLILCMSLAGCSSKDKQKISQTEKKEIKIGCMESSEPRVVWLSEGLKPLGYDVKAVLFDNNNLPATALKDGDLDGIMNNQLIWVNSFNKDNKCDLQMVKPYSYYSRNAVYSTKYKSIDEIPKNALFAMPNDPANMERGLVVLKDLGFITLGEKLGEFYSIVDIKDNPKNIKVIETERGKTVRSLNDVDAIFAKAEEMKNAGLDPNVFLYEEPNSKKYAHGLVVDGKNIDAGWVKEAMKVIESDEYKKKFNSHYAGTEVLFDNKTSL